MVHSSTHLGFCWHFEHLLQDSLVWKTKSGKENTTTEFGCLEGKKNRRQRFREQGGPSRESLQRSHIVSILRQIPALHFGAGLGRSSCSRAGNCKTSCELEQISEELPADVMWPLSAVSELAEDEIFRVDWNVIPASADPLRGFGYKTPPPLKRESSRGECRKQPHGGGHHCDEGGEGKLARGARKRSQVESIATALKFLNLPAGSAVVDFGSGSGALSLPLACLFKEFTFVCVDYKHESLRLLDLRAQAAKLNNLTTWQGRIEDYMEPFDTCVALHACGHATDLALLQALRWRAGYVVSPCCVGKLQFAVGSPPFTGIVRDNDNYTPENLRTAIATKNGYVFPNLSKSGNASVREQNGTNHSVVLENSGQCKIEKLKIEKFSADTLRNSREEIVTPKQGINENLSEIITHTDHCLTYPRSQWLRAVITRDEFLLLARTADWSSYDYDSWTSRLHSLCKVMVELDRNQASQELGYRSSLLSLADQKAGAVGNSFWALDGKGTVEPSDSNSTTVTPTIVALIIIFELLPGVGLLRTLETVKALIKSLTFKEHDGW